MGHPAGQRAQHLLPRQGGRWPWKPSPGYLSDRWRLRWGPIDDGVPQFDPPAPMGKPQAARNLTPPPAAVQNG